EVAAECAGGERAALRAEGAARLAHRVEAGADGGGPALRTTPAERRGRAETLRAYAPYLVIIAVFSLAQIGPVKALLEQTTTAFPWPGLHVLNADGTPAKSTVFTLDWLASSGTLLLLCGIAVAAIIGLRPGESLRVYWHTLCRLRTAALTVALVLGLAYLLNLSGQTTAIGHWLAGAGAAFAFLSPVLGWLGVAVTGSDTSANALFGSMQATVAAQTGADPLLYASANSSGGVIGKMISPQNLAIATAVTGIDGREGDLLRKVIGWSLLFLLAMCLLVVLQAGDVLGWMVP
ncbi:L-lactate permease, partial [Nocardiopsis composta]|uniref:L-lactate permease n=1 Tax=Nocardiopsis composta TaxID=157465 RepID=UPI0031D8CD62